MSESSHVPSYVPPAQKLVGVATIDELEGEINDRCLFHLANAKIHDPSKPDDRSCPIFIKTSEPSLLRLETVDGSRLDFLAFTCGGQAAAEAAAALLSCNEWIATDQMCWIHGADQFETAEGAGCKLPSGLVDNSCSHLSFGSSLDAQSVWFLTFHLPGGDIDVDRSINIYRVGEDAADLLQMIRGR